MSTIAKAIVRLRQAAAVQCPHCPAAIPFLSSTCPKCKQQPTLSAAVDATFGATKRRLEAKGRTASASEMRRAQWIYFAISLCILLFLLPFTQGRFASQALSVIFVTIVSGYVVWLIPPRWSYAYFVRAGRLFKLSVTLNILSVLMLIQIACEIWWGKAVTIATLFLVVIVGTFLFHLFVVPVAYSTYLLLSRGWREDSPGPEQSRRVRPD
jgi:hypothetical protein